MLHSHKINKLKSKKNDSGYVKLLDKVVYFLAIFGPFVLLPQVYEVWVNKEVAGISAFTWFSLAGMNAIILLYTIAHKDIRLTIMYSLYTAINFSVAIAAVLFT